ncbi:MAG: fructosamine kinase family protein [Planctomycetota bacterium]|nr:fructosamine kinase family protein [Planctomycetota bacterium]
MRESLQACVRDLFDPPPIARRTLSRGVGGEVLRVTLASGEDRVVKLSPGELDLRVEARMLDLLRAAGLPTPRVHRATHDALVMDAVDTGGSSGAGVERHAAELLAALHDHTSPDGTYGLHEANTIGPLPQDNTPGRGWVEFYGTRRLRTMADLAARRGSLLSSPRARLERLVGRLGEFIPDTPRPGLVHGDVWGGNVLCRAGRVAAFIDPAPYYADPEVELAFITMFGTFGQEFFREYGARRPIDAGFWDSRRDVYLLYPVLVHVALFPGRYDAHLDETLTRLGF